MMVGPYRACTSKGTGSFPRRTKPPYPPDRSVSRRNVRMFRCLCFLLTLLLVPAAMSPARAADEPDLIFKRSTVFKWLSPERQARHLRAGRPRGRWRRLPFHGAGARRLQGLDRRCRGGVRHLARLPADRTDPLQGEIRAGRGRVPQAPLAVLQEDADRPRLRRQTKRAGLYGLFRPDHRRLAEEFDLVGADHAVGRRTIRFQRCGDFVDK